MNAVYLYRERSPRLKFKNEAGLPSISALLIVLSDLSDND